MPHPSDFLGRGLQNVPDSDGSPASGGTTAADLPPVATFGSTWYGLPGWWWVSSEGSLDTYPNAVHYLHFTVKAPIVVTACRYAIDDPTGEPGHLRLGFYSSDSQWEAAGAPLWDSGEIVVDQGAVGTFDVDDLTVALPAGDYLQAFIGDIAFALRGPEGLSPGYNVDNNSLVGLSVAFQDYGPLPTPGPHRFAFLGTKAVPPLTIQWHNA